MFTRFDYDEIKAASLPDATLRELRASDDARDQALYLAVCSLERIAGADSPEGDSPEVDALRNLGRVQRLIEP